MANGYGYFRHGDSYNSVVFFDEVGLKVVFTKNLEPANGNILMMPIGKSNERITPIRKSVLQPVH